MSAETLLVVPECGGRKGTACRALSRDLDPDAALRALERRRGEPNVSQTVREGRERHGRRLAVDRCVRGGDEVPASLVRPARTRRELARRGRAQLAIAGDDALSADGAAEPELVLAGKAPGGGGLRAVDRELEVVPVPRGRLREDARPLKAADEAHEKGRVILGGAPVEPPDLRDDRLHLPTGDPFGEVEPVDPDVGDRARDPASRGIEAPVGIRLQEEPVLQKGAAYEMRRPEIARGHASGELGDQG